MEQQNAKTIENAFRRLATTEALVVVKDSKQSWMPQ